jgi:hypothetical protein
MYAILQLKEKSMNIKGEYYNLKGQRKNIKKFKGNLKTLREILFVACICRDVEEETSHLLRLRGQMLRKTGRLEQRREKVLNGELKLMYSLTAMRSELMS